MAKGARKTPKSAGKPSVASTTSPPASSAIADSLPSPFEPVSTVLASFVKTLPKDHIYIVHLEKTSFSTKRSAFLVPVLLNLIITAGLCWRIYYAVPIYLEQLITIFGHETSWTVQPGAMDTIGLVTVVSSRTVLLMIDYGLFGFLGRWPWEFIFGDKYGRYTGAFGWKRNVGFHRQEEVIVRRGRKWDVPIYLDEQHRKGQGKPGKAWTKEEELAVYTKCSDGLRKATVAKTALSLLDKDWDLDYRAMLDATELVDDGKLRTQDLDRVVLVPWDRKWYLWYPDRSETANGAVNTQVQEDSELETFKQHLIDIKCEDIFYRWVEIVQYETSLPSGFTAKRRKEAEEELRGMLKARHKDDQAFWEAIGGISGVPGLSGGR